MSEQSTRAVGEPPFEPEDYAFTAKLLRDYCNDSRSAFRAVCSNNLNIILAALDAQSEDMAPSAWQPIETAPSNVDVLLFCPDRGCDSNRARIELGCASHGWRNEVANNMSFHAWATHWMPLPSTPVLAVQS